MVAQKRLKNQKRKHSINTPSLPYVDEEAFCNYIDVRKEKKGSKALHHPIMLGKKQTNKQN